MVARNKSTKKRKSTKKPTALAPKFSLPEPETEIHFIPVRQAGVYVNEFSVLTLGAYWACIRVISETVAGLPFHVYRKRPGGGRDEQSNDPADWLLHFQANPETPAFQWRETVVAHALNWGNGYAEIERDMMGRPVWLWQITPDRVTPERDDFGNLVYRVKNYGAEDTVLPSRDVFHLRGLGFDGLAGYSVARMAARAIGAGIALEEAVSAFFSNDATPGGVLKTPGKLDEVAMKNLAASWMKRHSGPNNRRMIAILEQGLEFQQMAADPRESQMAENRQLTPAEICRWFRVPPHKIGDLAKATFSNIEQQAIEFVTDAIMPWCQRLEAEANVKLFGRTNRGTVFAKLNLLGLLRGDSKARSEFYQSMLDRGVFDINEVRSWEDLNPIGSDGDKRFVQANMALLEDAGEIEPAPPASPPVAETEPETDDGDLRAKLRPVIEDGCQRIVGREMSCVMDAARRMRGHRGEFDRWATSAISEQSAYLTKTLTPIMKSLGVDMAVATTFIDTYQNDWKRRAGLVFNGQFGREDYEPLGARYAGDLMQLMETIDGTNAA